MRRPSSSRIRRLLVIAAVAGAGKLMGVSPEAAVLALVPDCPGVTRAAGVGVVGVAGKTGGGSMARAAPPARPLKAPQLRVRTANSAAWRRWVDETGMGADMAATGGRCSWFREGGLS